MDGSVADTNWTVPEHVSPDRVFEFDIYADARVTDDVQGSTAELFKGAPDVFWSPRNGGHWMVRRFDMISEVVKDPEYFSVREMQIPRVANPPFMIPLSLDPPQNIPYRQAMMPKFSPKAIRDLEPKIREWAVKIIEDVADKGECDFIWDVSSLFPVSVFMELMGLPLEQLRECRDMADNFFKAHDSETVDRCGAEILTWLRAQIEHRQQHLGADVISHFLTTDVDGGRKLTVDEILAMCFVMFLGGMDTVTNLTGFSFRYLAGDPALQKRLAENPDLIPKFVDEGLRCFSVINAPRLVIKDTERFGVHFKTGDMVLNMLTIGARDERANTDPDTFNIDREGASLITFSVGPHLCIGHILARAEIRILTEEWLKRIPSFRAKPGVKTGFRIGTVTAIERLPLEWDLAKA